MMRPPVTDQPSPAEVVASTLRVRFAAEEHEKATPRTAAVVKGLILVGHFVWDAKVYTVAEACAEFGIKLSQTADEIEPPKANPVQGVVDELKKKLIRDRLTRTSCVGGAHEGCTRRTLDGGCCDGVDPCL